MLIMSTTFSRFLSCSTLLHPLYLETYFIFDYSFGKVLLAISKFICLLLVHLLARESLRLNRSKVLVDPHPGMASLALRRKTSRELVGGSGRRTRDGDEGRIIGGRGEGGRMGQ